VLERALYFNQRCARVKASPINAVKHLRSLASRDAADVGFVAAGGEQFGGHQLVGEIGWQRQENAASSEWMPPSDERLAVIMPPATVLLVSGSIRMKAPVVRFCS
jgi:hypothetical protein